MASEVFNLAILLSLKDLASGGLNRAEAQMRSFGKEGKHTLETLDSLRASMNKGLALGGVGLSGLALIGKGVQVAGDFQSSMTDLRTTLSQVGTDGKVNFNQLGADMQRAEAIAVRLGNALPGTTEDVLRTIQTLKQNGLATETILNGAADAVYNLSVASGELSTDTAKNFAQFGQLFKLKPDEYIKAADTFSRLFTSSGINSSELIEGLKYFQGRSGAALGISGLEDAEKAVRVMGLLRKQGLEGSIAGTSFNNLFSGYLAARNKKDDPVERLKQLEGIDLKLFDDNGKFAGIDNLFKQLEPLQKLTDEKRVTYLKDIFGEEGMSAATAILKTGADGWRAYNAEQEKVISLQQKNAEKAKDFNNQMEALTGTVKNLVVTGFTPLLPSITSGVTSLNTMVGSLQGFAKEHPALVETLGTLALYGSTALTVVGGIKALTSAWKIYTLTSSLSKGSGLLSFLTQTAEATNTATTRVAGFTGSLKTATTQTNDMKGAWGRLKSSPAIGLAVSVIGVAAAEIALTAFIEKYGEMVQKSQEFVDNARSLREEYDSLMGQGLTFNKPGDYKDNKGAFENQAKQYVESIKMGGNLDRALHPEKYSLWQNMSPTGLGSPYLDKDNKTVAFEPKIAAQVWQQQGMSHAIQDPNMLARVVAQLKSDPSLNENDLKLILQTLETIAGKDDMATALGILQKEKFGETAKPGQFGEFKLDLLGLKNQIQTPFQPTGQFGVAQKPTNQFEKPVQPKFGSAFLPPPTPSQSLFQPPSQTFGTSLIKPLLDLNTPISTITNSFNSLPTPITNTGQAFIGLPPPIASTTEAFTNSNQPLADWQQSISALPPPTDAAKQSISDLGDTSGRTTTSIGRLNSSANSVANSLGSVSSKLANWTPPTPQIQTYQIGVPAGASQGLAGKAGDGYKHKLGGYASGGVVERDGVAYLHAGNIITPARVQRAFGTSGGGLPDIFRNPREKNKDAFSSLASLRDFKFTDGKLKTESAGQFQNFRQINNKFNPERQQDTTINANSRRESPTNNSSNSPTINITYSPNLTINAGDKNTANELRENFRQELRSHSEEIGRIFTKLYENGRKRG